MEEQQRPSYHPVQAVLPLVEYRRGIVRGRVGAVSQLLISVLARSSFCLHDPHRTSVMKQLLTSFLSLVLLMTPAISKNDGSGGGNGGGHGGGKGGGADSGGTGGTTGGTTGGDTGGTIGGTTGGTTGGTV